MFSRRWPWICVVLVAVCIWPPPALAAVEATPEEFMAAHSFPAEVDRDKLLAALKDAGQNWTELAGALDQVSWRFADAALADVASRDLAWLTLNAPHLDRLELSTQILHSHLTGALAAAEDFGYDPTSEFFRRYVLNYRIDDEPVTDWRSELPMPAWWRFPFACEESEEARATVGFGNFESLRQGQVNAMQGFIIQERGFFGPEADPTSIALTYRGSKPEASLRLAAMWRTSGYATRFVSDNASGTSWVEVYNGDPKTYQPEAWLPVYPQAPERSGDPAAAAELCGGRISIVTAGDAFGREQVTARYSLTGTVQLVFTRAGIEVKGVEGYAITCWNNGQYVALDDLEYPVSAMDYPLDAGTPHAQDAAAQRFHLGAPGDYRLEAGVRYPGGVTDVHLLPFHVEPDTEQTLTLALDPPADLPMTALVERALGTPPTETGLQPEGRYIIAVYDFSEPSLRARSLMEPFAALSSVQYIAVDSDGGDSRDEALRTFLGIKPDDPRPVVVVVVNGETRLYRRGYDLNIADWVRRALDSGGAN
jgi:hypothetical protein